MNNRSPAFLPSTAQLLLWTIGSLMLHAGEVRAQVQRYDMGTASSPVAPGFTRVKPNTFHGQGGFGWVAGSGTIVGFDRPIPSPFVFHNQDPLLLRDGNKITSAQATFRATVSPGLRMCVVYVGEFGSGLQLPNPAMPIEGIDIRADGVLVADDVFARTVRKKATFDESIGGFKRVEFIADPGSDGVLDFTFSGPNPIPVESLEIYPYARPPISFDHTTNQLRTTAAPGSGVYTFVAQMNADDFAGARATADAIVGDDLGKAWAYAWLTGWLTGSEEDVDAALLRDPSVPNGPGVIESLLAGLDQDNAAVAFLRAGTRDFARGQLFLESRGYTLALFPENPDSIPNASVPDVGDIIANSCAGVQLLEQLRGDVLDPVHDAALTQSPYSVKAQYLIARNMFGRNTHVLVDVDPYSALAYDRYFLDIYHKLWGRLDPGGGSNRIFRRAVDVGVQAWLFENYIVPGNDPLLATWDGTAPTQSTAKTPVPFSQADFAAAWWAPQASFDWSQTDWGHAQWRYAHMMRDLVRWWSTARARSGDWGGGGGDDVEGAAALGAPTITVQEGGDNSVETGIRAALERVLFGPEVDLDQGYWYSPGVYLDAEHGSEYTTNPLLLSLPTNYGDPKFLEFTMRLMRNLEEPDDPATAWTGLTGAIPWRHLRAFRFNAHAVEPANAPGNPDMDITENMKALLPCFRLGEFSGLQDVARLWYEYGRAWSYEALRTDDPNKPVGVLPVGVDYATGIMGESGVWWDNYGQGNGGEVGLYNLEIYLAMLTAYRTHNQDLELLKPIARLIEFVNATTPDENQAAGSAPWVAAKVAGAAAKIAIAARHELEVNAALLNFDPNQITTVVDEHGNAWAKYVFPGAPPGGKDKSALAAMWDLDGNWLRHFWPFATVVVTYTDRIGFGSGDGMRGLHEARGGVPYQGSLAFVFTWYNSTPVTQGPAGELDFGVIVNELDQPNNIAGRILLHNVGTAPRRIGMRAWQLPLGVYNVRGGPDADGNDQLDFVAWQYLNEPFDQSGKQLLSGLIDAGQVQVVEFELVAPSAITPRADPAIGSDDVIFSPTGQVTLTVHNLGAVATTTGIDAELRAPNGMVLSTVSGLPVIDTATNLTPQTIDIQFPGYNVAIGETVVVALVVPSTMQQITTFNDQATATR